VKVWFYCDLCYYVIIMESEVVFNITLNKQCALMQLVRIISFSFMVNVFFFGGGQDAYSDYVVLFMSNTIHLREHIYIRVYRNTYRTYREETISCEASRFAV